MKKSLFLLLFLLPLTAATCIAQESRQDVSVSESAIMAPFVSGNGVDLHSTVGIYGILGSYRYDLTPHGAMELNYQYNQNLQHYLFPAGNYVIHDRFQEVSGAYVYTFNYRNFNPFIEAGIAAVMFSPIADAKTQTYQISRQTEIGGLYGAGIAYEISPSFDIRAEYRGIIVKTPTFNYPGGQLNTDVYYNIYDPVIGIAYHF